LYRQSLEADKKIMGRCPELRRVQGYPAPFVVQGGEEPEIGENRRQKAEGRKQKAESRKP
jgi:hypothetical protein